MANNYEEFSTAFPFPEDAAADFMNAVKGISGIIAGNPDGARPIAPYIFDKMTSGWNPPIDLKTLDNGEFRNLCEERYAISNLQLEYDRKDGSLWMGADSYVDMDAATEILACVMERHGIRNPVCFSICYYCDKLRIDEFGGVAWAVGPGIVKAMGTSQMSRKLGEEIMEELDQKDAPGIG